MKIYRLLITILLAISGISLNAQYYSLKGKVTSEGQPLPFVNIMIKGTNFGVATNSSGFYQMSGIPGGKHTIEVQAVGYKKKSKTIKLEKANKKIDFELKPDVLKLDQVVITASRNEIKRSEAPVIVNTVGPEKLESLNTTTLSDGLNFVPGLRTENNCQNCGFTQLRMNGMDGAYSQILINGRPIFSGLAGVYGLEILPAGMIERIEVTRGGGSALYGSNAIAGSVNVITKEPTRNSYAFRYNHQLTGVGIKNASPAGDYTINFNNSVISDNARNGMSLYGFYRKREPFDANNDNFSEIASIKNLTMGGHIYQRLGTKSKLSTNIYAISAKRRGGNKFNLPEHEADIAESVDHSITSASVSFDHFTRKTDKFSAYVSGQRVARDSYYGANQALDAYGNTSDLTYIAGAQYNADFDKLTITTGIENTGGFLKDVKKGYRYFDTITNEYNHVSNTTIADQITNTTGTFFQTEYTWGQIKTSLGVRYDHYTIIDSRNENANITGDVISPRINLLYDINRDIQARINYSQGYRAPQIYDEDLHIETSGARKVIHKNADDLKQETSHSAMASLDIHPDIDNHNSELLVEAFYTKLVDPFTNEFGTPDNKGQVVYTRKNADGFAHVFGLNLELNWFYSDLIRFSSGFTIQKSEYSKKQEFNEKSFFRTPDNYGYATLQYTPAKNWKISISEDYTGTMLIPYFGPETNKGKLRKSDIFFDTGIKVCYHIPVKKYDLHIFAGIKNIFNAYQDDFDSGINRDPGYIYGPMMPRTVHFGVKLGNFKN